MGDATRFGHRRDLEAALKYIGEDELVEITPKSIRMRKIHLKEPERKRNERGGGRG